MTKPRDFDSLKQMAASGAIDTVLVCFVDILKELPATMILRPFNFNTLATELYQYSSSESLELGSLHALTIIVFLTISVFLLDNVLEKKLITKTKKN